MGAEYLALSLVVLLFSVILHEVMHGYVALRFGDRTAENAGRLTLNPIPHIDPFGTILLPAIFLISAYFGGGLPFFIAWAKPVPVNPLNFKDVKLGELLVSLAGVGSNFGLALLGTVLYHITPDSMFLKEVWRFMVGINLMLGVFNLLPIPPLDGSKALMSQLSYDLARQYQKIESYGIIILIALLYFGVISFILTTLLLPLHRLLQVPFL